MAPASGGKSGGDQGAGGAGAGWQSRTERQGQRRRQAAGRRKETKRRSLAGKGGELLICPLVDGARLSSLGEKGKVRTVVDLCFSTSLTIC